MNYKERKDFLRFEKEPEFILTFSKRAFSVSKYESVTKNILIKNT